MPELILSLISSMFIKQQMIDEAEAIAIADIPLV